MHRGERLSATADVSPMPLTNVSPFQSPIPLTADLTISAWNAHQYYGQFLAFAAAHTVIISSGLPPGFWCWISPPASGSASIASDGTALLNGSTSTLLRSAANILVWVIMTGVDSYAVTGSDASSGGLSAYYYLGF